MLYLTMFCNRSGYLKLGEKLFFRRINENIWKVVKSSLMTKLKYIETDPEFSNKVSIVGVGRVGAACAFSLLTMNVTENVVLTDLAVDKLKGEVLDLQHGSAFVPHTKIKGDTDFSVTKNSRICVITAGIRKKPGQTYYEHINQNVNILKTLLPKLLQYSPKTIFLIVTNPVDVLTYAAWKISGRPLGTVIGTGTSLDSARLKFLISKKIGVNIDAVQVWIVGEHGDASVPIWSNLQVGGVNLQQIKHPFGTSDNLNELHYNVINSGYEIVKLKGYSTWAIGLNAANICKSILRDSNHLHALSTLVKGFHGVQDDVFMSLPCVLGRQGISHVVPLIINDKEKEDFIKAALKMYQIQKEVNI